jgi:Ca-activated chloride channel family protein
MASQELVTWAGRHPRDSGAAMERERMSENTQAKRGRTASFFGMALIGLVVFASLALGWHGDARAQVVQVEPALGRSEFETGKEESVKVRVALRGLGQLKGVRTPLNVAFVLDRSKAMEPHLAEARKGIIAGLQALEPDDTVALVVFDDTVEVLVESMRVGDLTGVEGLLEGVTAGGRAGVFAGVVKGAVEARKALARERVNRIVLLNAGGADVGPNSAREMSQLAASLRRDGIAVTSLGVGLAFDEDLLATLAEESGGQHVFVEESRDLAPLLRSGIKQLGAVVARDAWIRLSFGADTNIARVLGRRAEVLGNTVSVPMPAVQAGQSDDVVLEARLPKEARAGQALIATVETHYVNIRTGSPEKVSMVLMANFVDEAGAQPLAVERAGTRRREMPEVEIASACWEAKLLVREVVALRNRGEIDRARVMLEEGFTTLMKAGERFEAPVLKQLANALREDGERLETSQWQRQRKVMSERSCAELRATVPGWKRRF